MAEQDFTTSIEKRRTLSLNEVNEIGLKIDEALSMAEILSYSATGIKGMGTPELIYTYFSMLEDKIEAIKESFKQATAPTEASA
jgi:hypothetical protein